MDGHSRVSAPIRYRSPKSSSPSHSAAASATSSINKRKLVSSASDTSDGCSDYDSDEESEDVFVVADDEEEYKSSSMRNFTAKNSKPKTEISVKIEPSKAAGNDGAYTGGSAAGSVPTDAGSVPRFAVKSTIFTENLQTTGAYLSDSEEEFTRNFIASRPSARNSKPKSENPVKVLPSEAAGKDGANTGGPAAGSAPTAAGLVPRIAVKSTKFTENLQIIRAPSNADVSPSWPSVDAETLDKMSTESLCEQYTVFNNQLDAAINRVCAFNSYVVERLNKAETEANLLRVRNESLKARNQFLEEGAQIHKVEREYFEDRLRRLGSALNESYKETVALRGTIKELEEARETERLRIAKQARAIADIMRADQDTFVYVSPPPTPTHSRTLVQELIADPISGLEAAKKVATEKGRAARSSRVNKEEVVKARK